VFAKVVSAAVAAVMVVAAGVALRAAVAFADDGVSPDPSAQISSGHGNTVAVDADGKLWAWRTN
jgi:hypothetical protein